METVNTFLKPIIDLQGTGAQIKKLRKINGFTVHELQEIFGFEYPQAIYAWEQGKNAPSIDNIIILAQLFRVEVSEIIVTAAVEVSISCRGHNKRLKECDCKSCTDSEEAAVADTGTNCGRCRFKKSA